MTRWSLARIAAAIVFGGAIGYGYDNMPGSAQTRLHPPCVSEMRTCTVEVDRLKAELAEAQLHLVQTIGLAACGNAAPAK
jgi:hypothetical protein